MGIKTINFYKINGIIIGHFGKNMSENIQLWLQQITAEFPLLFDSKMCTLQKRKQT
jgi:hypothetical protein